MIDKWQEKQSPGRPFTFAITFACFYLRAMTHSVQNVNAMPHTWLNTMISSGNEGQPKQPKDRQLQYSMTPRGKSTRNHELQNINAESQEFGHQILVHHAALPTTCQSLNTSQTSDLASKFKLQTGSSWKFNSLVLLNLLSWMTTNSHTSYCWRMSFTPHTSREICCQ